MEMAAAEQGQPAQVVYKLEQLTAFDGEAKIELVGLPPKTATTPLTITSGSEEVIFTVTTEADAPVGQHKSLFCVLTITKEGEPILHNIGQGGVLRIDAPPPAPKKEEPKAEAPPAPEQPKEQAKPLSRLEKLRLEQQKREAGE